MYEKYTKKHFLVNAKRLVRKVTGNLRCLYLTVCCCFGEDKARHQLLKNIHKIEIIAKKNDSPYIFLCEKS